MAQWASEPVSAQTVPAQPVPTQTARNNGPLSIPGVLKHLSNGGVVVSHRGEVLYSHRGDEGFVVASTLKIATALAAIHHLGLDYRYKTEFYVSSAGDLIIRGFGDPFLVSEEWKLIVRRLIDGGKLPRQIRNLVLDPSAFSPDLTIPGLASTSDPYNASNGALAANFNTLHLRVEPGGRVVSAESQTPLTPVARRLAKGLAPGKHRINISREPGVPLRYVGELASAFLAEGGLAVTGQITNRPVGDGDSLIYSHTNSRSLREVIAGMMLYSNNFIANQLLLAVGLETTPEPTTLAGSVRTLERFLIDEVGLDPQAFEVVEGSGISRQNRFTPRALARVVEAFCPYRKLLSKHNGVMLKTGTLTGVYALAGYLPSRYPLSFVILLNQKRNARDAVLEVLKKEVSKSFEPRIAAAGAY